MPLDPEIAAYLEIQKSLPPRERLTLEQTRLRMREAAREYGGRKPEASSVEDRIVAQGVRVRDYRVPQEAAGSPLLLYFHGGRFISGDLDSHDTVCRRLARAAGFRVIAVDYRLAPEHPFPAAVEDALAAVDWALVESNRVATAGDSAGGNIAAVVAAERRRQIRSQVLIYPMIDATRSLDSHLEFGHGWGPSSLDMKRGWDQYLPPNANARDPRSSPLFHTDLEKLPSAFVLTAEYDCLRDEGEAYARKMEQAGNRVEMKRYAGAIHGFITLSGIAALARQALEEIGGYLRRQ